jgi:hypothetical protein
MKSYFRWHNINEKEENMHKFKKHTIIFLLISALICVPFGTSALAAAQANDTEITGSTMTADLILVRPLGIVATVLGCAVFVVSLPFSALGHNTKQASQKLVKEPAKFTFTRPLGAF